MDGGGSRERPHRNARRRVGRGEEVAVALSKLVRQVLNNTKRGAAFYSIQVQLYFVAVFTVSIDVNSRQHK